MVLERLESFVENLVEGAFSVVLRGRIEPLEIARRLTREADERKIITLNRVYVPNVFTVGLHPADLAVVQPIAPELEAEFQRFVGEWAVDRDYTVTGPIRVTLAEDEKVGRCRIKVRSALDDIRASETAARMGLGFELQVDETIGCLWAEEGPDAGRAFTLQNRLMILGGGRDCDIRLDDPELPEACATVVPAGSSWRIEVLDGAPCLWVNEEPVREARLTDGDTIRFGGNVVRFHLSDVKSRVMTDAA